MLGFLAGIPGRLKTVADHLSTYLSSTRCARIDYLDAAISGRAPAGTALSNATWTDARAGFLDMAVSGVARIKSIQHLSGTIPWNANSVSVACSSVATGKTLIIRRGEHITSGDGAELNRASVYFSSGTSVVAQRGGSGGSPLNALEVHFTLLEFY